DFHYEPYDTLGSHGELQPAHIHTIRDSMAGDAPLIYPGFRDFLRAQSEPGQWNAVEAGLFMLLLAVSVGVACMRERTRPSRWLAVLESPAIVPLGVLVATGSLLLAMAQWPLFNLHRGSPDDIPWYAAWASAGAVVAYASMLLRRRRREALS
ncbi:MAG TPA: hypothetical protein VJ696_06295, partial [Rhodanobacteraceae bacterium]|nr:hypothetical protein [Rhodanobacteraceae bacterium]